MKAMTNIAHVCRTYRDASEQHPEEGHSELVQHVVDRGSLICFRTISTRTMNHMTDICRTYREVREQCPDETHDGIVRLVTLRQKALDERRQRFTCLALAAGAALLIALLWVVAR